MKKTGNRMLIDKAEIERVKRANELVAFIRNRGVVLTPRGKQLVGLCPFPDDHEPSRVVDAKKQLWNCLGACHEGGDVYRFVIVLNMPGIRKSGWKLTIYRGERPSDLGWVLKSPHLEREFPNAISVEELIEIIDGAYDQKIYVSVFCGYEILHWNNEICDCEPSTGGLLLEYESPQFGGGFRYKRLGAYHLHFYDRYYFSLRSIDPSACQAKSPADVMKLMKFGENIQFVKGMFKELALALNPDHQILVDEGDRVNPLIFHMVYHSKLSGYSFDLQRIIQLHTRGGSYFHEGQTDYERAYRSVLWHQLPYADDIRNPEDAEALIQQLDVYTAVLGETISPEEIHLKEEDVLHIITDDDRLELEVIREGFCISHASFLHGYLDALYLRLLDAAAVNFISKT